MNKLVTGIGGPTPRCFVKSIIKHGSSFKNAKFKGTDINPTAIGLYQKDLFEKTYVIPPATHPQYWIAIDRIIQENNIEIAIILPELEVNIWGRMQKLV
jgi:hypothetical protein